MLSYGKCMGLPVSFPQYRKMQQNPWYGESLGNRYSYFSQSMSAFFPSNSHPMVYFSIWEMHGFPHKFPTVRENAIKPLVWGKSGKLILILFPQYGCFFPIRFPPYGIYFIIWEMHGFPHQFFIVQENATKPFVRGEPGKLVLTLFPQYG